MKTFRLFSMAALALVMAACSSEDNALENATPAKPGLIPFSATVAPLSGATTRTEYTEVTSGDDAGKINVAWKEGDQIFIARLTPDLGTAGRVTVGKLNGDGSAPLSGNISGADGNEIEAYYPASAYDDWGTFTEKYKAQDGRLSGIQDNLDYRKGTGEISVIGGKATLADKLQMKSLIAIWKLTLQNTSGANLNATKVTIKDGSEIKAATKDISATSEVYMALPLDASPTTFNNLTIEATTADGTYTYAAPSAVNLSYSTYYQSTVKMAKQASVPTGAISGKFSVSSTKKVYFSKGNLRYVSSTWSFFDNQYDYYTSYSEDAWDKFGWSTSANNYGKNTSTDNSTYSGDFADWGATMGTGWFTLSSAEWTYLFNTRSASTVGGTSNGRYAKAKVNDVQGMILFPDTYTHPDGVTAPTGVNATGDTGWNGNNYSSADWTKMESAGCVFLPAAGYRNGSSVYEASTNGIYRSATPNGADNAYNVDFNSGDLNPAANSYVRGLGFSVRLVRDVK